MSKTELARRAAWAARWQRIQGDDRPLRELFRAAFSLLRFVHHRWAEGR